MIAKGADRCPQRGLERALLHARRGRRSGGPAKLADHPDWVDGLTFASGRLTAEEGPAPFYAFSSKYRDAFGVEEVGVKTHAGYEVIQPPEYGDVCL